MCLCVCVSVCVCVCICVGVCVCVPVCGINVNRPVRLNKPYREKYTCNKNVMNDTLLTPAETLEQGRGGGWRVGSLMGTPHRFLPLDSAAVVSK